MQNLFDNGDTLRWREQSLTQQVTESEQVGELYREQFEVGRRDVIDLLNVQRERFEAERQLINLRIERKRIGIGRPRKSACWVRYWRTG